MGFASGSISFRRYAVIGEARSEVVQDMLDRLSEHTLRPRELGVPEEDEYGWSGGRHVLDGSFSFENNVYAQIGLVMLIGLSAKNAILIVEFAKVEDRKSVV